MSYESIIVLVCYKIFQEMQINLNFRKQNPHQLFQDRKHPLDKPMEGNTLHEGAAYSGKASTSPQMKQLGTPSAENPDAIKKIETDYEGEPRHYNTNQQTPVSYTGHHETSPRPAGNAYTTNREKQQQISSRH